MTPDVAKLTAAEREALRLWQKRASAKEIAIELGISFHAVNERLRSARRRLGVDSSNDAARLLAEAEVETGTYKRIVYKPAAVAATDAIAPNLHWERQQATTVGSAVREAQAQYLASPLGNRPGIRLPFPTDRAKRNDLTAAQRLLWIGGAAFGILVGIGTLVTIAEAVSRPVITIVHALS